MKTILIFRELKYSLFLILVVLLGLSLIVPLETRLSDIFIDPLITKPIAGSTIRILIILGLFYFISKKGLLPFNGLAPFKVSNLWILGVSVIFILLLAYSSYEVYQHTEGVRLFLFGINNWMVGTMEELLFRGIVFPLLILHFAGRRHPIVEAAIFSSVIFGFVHLTGLVRHPDQIVQVSYIIIFAMSTGFLMACVLLRTRNILVPIFLHFLVDFTNGISDLEPEVAVKAVPTLSTIVITYAVVIGMAIILIGIGLWLIRPVQKEEWLQKTSRIKL